MWHGIAGCDEIITDFRKRLANGRLASTFLFVGPAGVGKRLFALKLAQALLCEQAPEGALDPCERCPSCQQVMAGTHPDVHLVEGDKGKSRVTIDQLIGKDERRMQEGLVHDIGLKPFSGRRKIGIIDDADTLGNGQGESANCLLKTLEEPPPNSLLILLGTSEQRQLPTIRSRSQVVRFAPLSTTLVANLLLEQNIATSPEEAKTLAELSGGSLQRAMQLAAVELREFRTQLFRFLADPQPEAQLLAKPLAKLVEEAGKEGALKRARLRIIVGMAMEFYRELLQVLAGNEPTGDANLRQAVATAARHWNRDVEIIAEAVERSSDALWQIDANANLATLVEAWLDDLAQLRLEGKLV